jgi:predicted membrane channel-forming protein YqfA (hemolysin III family)
MSTNPGMSVAAAPREGQRATLLAAIGAWTIVAPYIGTALGYDVNVRPIIEFVDHVVPGVIVVAAALVLRRLALRGRLAGQAFALLASGVAFLAGFWVFATHLPLVQDAANSRLPWDAALWHSIAALPIVGLAIWFVVRSIPAP